MEQRIEQLEQQLRERDRIIEELRTLVKQLQEKNQELEAQLVKDSHNSSKPPSSDGFKRRNYRKRPPSTKTSGGQPGHEGHTLQRSETPDSVAIHRPEVCPECQANLKEVPGDISEKRQVVDILPIQVIGTEHHMERVTCPQCGKVATGAFPPEVKAAVQYGPGVKSYGVYINQHQLVPLERTCEVLEDLAGVQVSEATVQSWVKEAAELAEPLLEKIREGILASPYMGGDETGMRIRGKLNWVHVASTDTLTYLAWHPKRGRKAMNAIGIWPNYQGKAMHDRLSSYDIYTCQHRLCKAHIFRDLTYVEEVEEMPWTGKMRSCLAAMHQAAQEWAREGKTSIPEPERMEYVQNYQALIDEGYRRLPAQIPPSPKKKGKPKQSKAKLLVDVLDKRREQVIGFLDDTAEEFTNNQRERDLRMIKVKEKISGGFRSDAGATAFCAIRSVVSSCRKQGHQALTSIRSLLLSEPLHLVYSS